MSKWKMVVAGKVVGACSADAQPEAMVEGAVWLPCGPDETAPVYDPATQRLDGPKDKIGADWVVVGWDVVALTPEEIAAGFETAKAAKRAAVMAKRDAVIDGGVPFGGKQLQTGPADRENIAGAAQLAFMAVVAGAQAGNLRWADPNSDFGWIATDNTVLPMDAQTVIAFAKTVAGMKSQAIFTARAFKDAIDNAADYAALDAIDITAGWPS